MANISREYGDHNLLTNLINKLTKTHVKLSQIQIDWFNSRNKRYEKFQSFVSLLGGVEGLQHGSLGQWIGWHSRPGCAQHGGKFCAFPTWAPTIATINTKYLNNNFKRDSIITKLSFQRQIKWISDIEFYLE